MNRKYGPETYRIASGDNELVFKQGNRVNGDQYRFTVVGPGTADIQPIVDGQSTHTPYTVANDSIVVDVSSLDNVDISASGGNITVIFTALGGF